VKPRRNLVLDTALFALLAWVCISAALSHATQGTHAGFMFHAGHALGGVLMALGVAVHLAFHLPWIRSQIRPPVRQAATPHRPRGHRSPLHAHLVTPYIQLLTRRCTACWECNKACPQHVLGKAVLFRHRHAHVDNAGACKGCGKCAKACPNEAIVYLRRPPQAVASEA
jgi:Pyruvate/2-oxoacid:ferredoxin oxidoreductase delta subunit